MEMLSFETIYKQYYKRSLLFVKSFVKDDMIAEDIVSDALFSLWKEMQENEVSSAVGLLIVMLKNKSLNYLNRQRIEQKVMANIQQYQLDDLSYKVSTLKALDPADMLSKEVTDIIKDTLQQLPRRTAMIFEMNRYEHLTAKEIAEKLGITQKGVEYHIAVSLKELRKALKDYLPLLLLIG